MVENVIKFFLGLVAILYIMHNPNGLENVVQAFLNAADQVAQSLTHIKLGTGSK